MMRARIVAVLACVAAVAVIAGCGSSSSGGGGGGGSSSGQSKGTIAFLLSGPDLYYQYGLDGAKAAAAKLGYSLKVYPNPNISPSVELANVQNAIAAGVKAIDGYSVGLSTETATINKAAQSNIPIFLMYGYSHQYLHDKGVIGFEQTPLVPYGEGPGAYVKKHESSGGQTAVITGQLGRGDAEGYRQGYLEALGCSGNTVAGNPPMSCANGVKYVDTETGHWLRPDAYKAAQDIISKYPSLSSMFVENEDMAVGVHTALTAAHKNVMLVSANGAPYGLAGIKAGWLSASNTCSPSLEGLYSIRYIDGYLNKKVTGGKLYYSHTVMVDKSNVNDAVGWTFFKSPSQVNHWMNAPLLPAVANPPT